MTPPDPAASRIDALEESLAYTDRQAEQLNDAVTDLGKQLVSLADRMARVEARLGTLTDRLGEFEDRGVEPPPHSAGPDIAKEPL